MQRTDIPSLKAEETLKRAEALDVPEEIRQQISGQVDDVNVGTRLWIAGLLPLGTHAEQALRLRGVRRRRDDSSLRDVPPPCFTLNYAATDHLNLRPRRHTARPARNHPLKRIVIVSLGFRAHRRVSTY
jgi:hypothetical protein